MGAALLLLVCRTVVAEEDAGTIHGKVVDFTTQRLLAGRTIAVGALRTTTDAEGRFSLAHVPPAYDLIIVEPDKTTATIYRHLERRDPLLAHTVHRESRWNPQRSAAVRGMLSGGGPYPTVFPDYVTVYLFSEQQGTQRALLPGELLSPGATPRRPGYMGPGFGPLSVGWDGAPSVAASLVAVRRVPQPPVFRPTLIGPRRNARNTQAYKTWVGHSELTLTGGETTVDLALSQPRVQHISGTTNADLASAVYRLPFPGAIIPLTGTGEEQPTPFDFAVPDLRALKGQYCVSARWNTTDSSTTLCGLAPGANQVRVVVDLPPRMKPPQEIAAPGMPFSWTGDASAVYLLEIEVANPTPVNPSVYIYTTDSSARWPDLASVGIPFPEGAAAYSCRVRGLGPYSDLDEAVGPDGIGAVLPTQSRRSVSHSHGFYVDPPAPTARAGRQEPPCDYEYGTAIVCNQYTSIDDRELYMLSAINMKLRHYPKLAGALGMSCVRDCAGARRFVKALSRYRNDHPGFDANEPREP